MERNKKIGIFDSGLGGLTVLKQITKLLPDYDYVYLADNQHIPYGEKTPEQIFEYTKKSVDFLFKEGCELIILACNTATGVALRKLQQEYLSNKYPDKRVLGVIRPAAEEAIESGAEHIGIMATEATVNWKSFINEFIKLEYHATVVQQACPELVPLIEQGKIETEEMKQTLQGYLDYFINEKINTLILGCTHYELLEDQIRSYLPTTISVISEGKITAEKLKDYLQRHTEIEETLSKHNTRTFFSTAPSEQYSQLIHTFSGAEFTHSHPLHLASI